MLLKLGRLEDARWLLSTLSPRSSDGSFHFTSFSVRMTKRRNAVQDDVFSLSSRPNGVSGEISSFIFTKQPAAVIPTRIAGQSEYQGSLFIKPLRTLAKTSFGEFLLPLLSMGEGRIRCSAGTLPLNVIARKFKISRLHTGRLRQ